MGEVSCRQAVLQITGETNGGANFERLYRNHLLYEEMYERAAVLHESYGQLIAGVQRVQNEQWYTSIRAQTDGYAGTPRLEHTIISLLFNIEQFAIAKRDAEAEASLENLALLKQQTCNAIERLVGAALATARAK